VYRALLELRVPSAGRVLPVAKVFKALQAYKVQLVKQAPKVHREYRVCKVLRVY
jgi:hypothetical protein